MNSYNRIKKIGAGAMGCAHLISRKTDGAMLVVKEINVASLGEKERQEAMLEVEVHRQLRHPNIVLLHEAFIEAGNLFIVMEFADAGDLSQLIRNAKGRRFKEEKILDLFGQICLGMHHIHSLNILHRDLKTANILLTRAGHIKLADFGIARVMSSETQMATTMIGTPYYLSPEICEDKPYNHKSDLWSLGCVLYELVTLKHAFEGNSLPALVMNIIKGEHPSIPDGYSRDLSNVISAMLQKNPDARPDIIEILGQPFLKQRLPASSLPTELRGSGGTRGNDVSNNAPVAGSSGEQTYAYSNKPKAIARMSQAAPEGKGAGWGAEWKKTLLEAPQAPPQGHRSGQGGGGAAHSRPGTGESADWMSEMQQRIGAVKSSLATQHKDETGGSGGRGGKEGGREAQRPSKARPPPAAAPLSPRPGGPRPVANDSRPAHGGGVAGVGGQRDKGPARTARGGGGGAGDAELERYPNLNGGAQRTVAEGIADKKARLAAQRGAAAEGGAGAGAGGGMRESKVSSLLEAKLKDKELKGKIKAAKPKISLEKEPFSPGRPGQQHNAVNKGVGQHSGSGGIAFTVEEGGEAPGSGRPAPVPRPKKDPRKYKEEEEVVAEGKVADKKPEKGLVTGIGFVTGNAGAPRLSTGKPQERDGKKKGTPKGAPPTPTLADIMRQGRQKKRESGDFDDIVVAGPVAAKKGSKGQLIGGKAFGNAPDEQTSSQHRQRQREGGEEGEPRESKGGGAGEERERGAVVPFELAPAPPPEPEPEPEGQGTLRERCESLRFKAEEVLGMDLFLKVYKTMKSNEDDSGALPAFLLDQVGAQRLPIVRDINQLIACEDRVYGS